MEISKELLVEILKVPKNNIQYITEYGSKRRSNEYEEEFYIFFSQITNKEEMTGAHWSMWANPDALIRLCKEWCIKHGFYIASYLTFIGASSRLVNGDKDTINMISNTKTELEAVVKATKWVARNQGLIPSE